MAVYFESRTPNGVLQISDSQPVLYLRNKTRLGTYYVETKTFAYAINGGSEENHDVHIYSLPIIDRPLYIGTPSSGVAHVFPAHVCYVQYWYDYTPAYSLGKKNVLGVSNISKNIADDMLVYEFAQGSAPSTGLGLECYNENGERIYTSDRPTMKLLYANLFKHCNYGDEWDGPYQDLNITHNFGNKSIAFNCNKSGYYNFRIHSVSEMGKGNFPICKLSDGIVQMVTVTHNNHESIPPYNGGADNDYIHYIISQCDEGNQTAYSVVDVTDF